MKYGIAFDQAISLITDELIESLNHGDGAELNSEFTLYKYLEEDIIVVVLKEEWTEIATVLKEEEGFIYEMVV